MIVDCVLLWCCFECLVVYLRRRRRKTKSPRIGTKERARPLPRGAPGFDRSGFSPSFAKWRLCDSCRKM